LAFGLHLGFQKRSPPRSKVAATAGLCTGPASGLLVGRRAHGFPGPVSVAPPERGAAAVPVGRAPTPARRVAVFSYCSSIYGSRDCSFSALSTGSKNMRTAKGSPRQAHGSSRDSHWVWWGLSACFGENSVVPICANVAERLQAPQKYTPWVCAPIRSYPGMILLGILLERV
jgi:hypothetical protein